jgi:acyl-CoA thioesterase-1
MSRALAGAVLLLAACGSSVLESHELASLGGTTSAEAPPVTAVTAPKPVRLYGASLAKLPPKRAGLPRVLFMGDSIAAGFGLRRSGAPYPDLLGERLAGEERPIEVLNAGVFGFTTSGGLALRDLSSLHPDVVVIELGGNDFLLGRSLDAARENLVQMVKAAREMGARVLLVGVKLPHFLRETQRGQRFDALYPALADELDVPLVPDMFEDALGNPRFMQADMIHPTAEGQMVVAENILPALRALVLETLGR